MIWDKKTRPNESKGSEPTPAPPVVLPKEMPKEAPAVAVVAPPEPPKMEKPMVETTQRAVTSTSTSLGPGQTTLGRSVVLKGELTGSEDLTIEGQFEGNVNVKDHCVTVGPQGQVKAEIHARQVIVFGRVDGKIAAREKVELRKTAYVVGDMTSAGVAIEDGAYFKGSIEILREGAKAEPAPRPVPAVGAALSKA
jgi:cytoskeletal protein CcmA (bactofilin family)